MPEHKSSDNWSSQTKFTVVVETSAMSEVDLNEYGRAKGLYLEQVRSWHEISVQVHDNAGATNADSNHQNTVLRKLSPAVMGINTAPHLLLFIPR